MSMSEWDGRPAGLGDGMGGPEYMHGDRVTQPGTIEPDSQAYWTDHGRVIKQAHDDGVEIKQQGSDRFTVRFVLVDGTKAWSLLPPDPTRKSALIKVPGIVGGGETFSPANPAPATNLSLNISPRNPFSVQQAQYVISTSAVVANRQPQLLLAGISYPVGNVNVAASQVNTNIWIPNGALGNGVTATGPIPGGVIYPAGTLIVTNMLNMQAGDQISAIAFVITQYNGAGVVIGTEPLIDTNPATGYPVQQGELATLYTSKAPLYATNPGAGQVQVSMLIEQYMQGMPVN